MTASPPPPPVRPSPPRRSTAPLRVLACVLALVSAMACQTDLDAGKNRLPVDARNPIILYQDDWSADWLGEYAFLLANAGEVNLVGLVINASKTWNNLAANTSGWNGLIQDAQQSGLKNLPTLTSSAGGVLTRPDDGVIESTKPNNSAGAKLIVSVSRTLVPTASSPKVAIVAGTSLTDIADAYLIDPTVAQRVVVIANVGHWYDEGYALMNSVNGDLDPWASWIVGHRFTYAQVSTGYDQTQDLTDEQVANLPANALTARIKSKLQPTLQLIRSPTAADQVALFAVVMPGFSRNIERLVVDDTVYDPTKASWVRLTPPFSGDPATAWVVTDVDGTLPRARFWQLLSATGTSSP